MPFDAAADRGSGRESVEAAFAFHDSLDAVDCAFKTSSFAASTTAACPAPWA